MMDLNVKKQDDFLPINVIQDFVRSYISGFDQMFRDTGMATTWRAKELNNIKYEENLK